MKYEGVFLMLVIFIFIVLCTLTAYVGSIYMALKVSP